ncbi:MAG: hypothetical protein Q4B54_10135 [Coriobacteriales bacterium]|nr:hypothetical protein [Coriobacteriales bacterium]
MALDWNQEVSLSSIKNILKKGKGASLGSGDLPSKTTMNLYQGEERTFDLRKLILAGILVLVVLIALLKFGVFDQLDALNRKQTELAEQQALAAAVKEGTTDYASVKEVYDAYTAHYGAVTHDAISILDLVEQHVMSITTVTKITLADNTLTLTLSNVPLDTVGNIAKDLENQTVVKSVNVTTAGTQNSGQNTVSATLVISLVSPETNEGA